jgi:transposase
VFSSIEDGYVSQNDELFKALGWLTKTFGTQGVRVFDRGFDSNNIYEYLLRENLSFIVRADKQRHLMHKGKSKNILGIANEYKGKCNLKIRGVPCKTSVISVKLPAFRDVPLHLVTVYGLGDEPLMLLTNLNSTDSKLSNAIAKAYLLRWRVEENFRFKKQQFEMEGFRVRKLKAIRALHRIVTILVGFTALLSEQREDFALPAQLVLASKRIFPPKLKQFLRSFLQYAIADGMAALLQRAYLPLARHNLHTFGCSAQIALRGF